MIRKNIGGDISEEEFEKVLKPFIDDYDNFVYSYILPAAHDTELQSGCLF